jgi:hypothetical protein
MAMKDIFLDLALLEFPPLSAGEGDDLQEAAETDETDLDQWRSQQIQQMELAWDAGGEDPVLAQLAMLRRQQLAAERRMRLLLAYAREFVGPRPYPLAALAEASGMSISGVRTAYDEDEVSEVAQITGSKRRQPLSRGERDA